jgi:hypothetical protein
MKECAADGSEIQLVGMVTDVFARHIVLMTATGRFLAELDQKSTGYMPVKEGDYVRLSGEIHASDVRVTQIARIEDDAADPSIEQVLSGESTATEPISALSMLEADGFTILTAGRREQTHLEFLVSDNRGGGLFELHTEFDGRLRKLKLVHEYNPKWGPALR